MNHEVKSETCLVFFPLWYSLQILYVLRLLLTCVFSADLNH
jgi:hypothetical protein